MKHIILTDENFDEEVVRAEKPVLVYFWAGWCSDCKIFSPIFEQLTKAYEGKIKMAKLDTENNIKIPEKYFVMSIPTLILFIRGKEVVRFVEQYNKSRIQQTIDEGLYKGGEKI